MTRRIAIVILNFVNYEDTINCVNCALNQTYSEYEVIVVENGSPNQSYKILQFIFGKCPKVHLLKIKKNLGFAKGNNMGIRYAKAKLNADYVFVCNSDVIFGTDLFETIANTEYRGIGAISPTVYNLEGIRQTPSIVTDNIYIKILSQIIGILFTWINSPITSLLYHVIKKRKKTKSQRVVMKEKKIQKHVLMGCSYFLTPEFFQYYRKLYPNTFLYWEEINLLLYLEKVKLTAKMIETTPVIHKDKRSTIHFFKTTAIDKKKLEYSTFSMLKSIPLLFMNYNTIRKRYN